MIQKDVPIYAEWVGTLDGMVNATIRAQVQGYLIKQNYKEGDFVKKGQVLFEIDPRPYQAALEQAKGAAGPGRSALADGKGQSGAHQASGRTERGEQKDLDDAIGAEESTHASVMVGKGGRRKGPVEPRVSPRSPLPLMASRDRQGPDRQSGRPRVHRGVDDRFYHRPDQVLRFFERAGVHAGPGEEVEAGWQDTPGADPFGRKHLPPERRVCLCGPPGGCEDRYDQGGHHLSEPAESPPARAVQPGPRRDGDQEGCTGHSPAGGDRGPGESTWWRW